MDVMEGHFEKSKARDDEAFYISAKSVKMAMRTYSWLAKLLTRI